MLGQRPPNVYVDCGRLSRGRTDDENGHADSMHDTVLLLQTLAWPSGNGRRDDPLGSRREITSEGVH